MKNEYEKICDELEKERDIETVYKKVREHVGNNYAKYLQLKADANSSSYTDYISMMIAMGALIMSTLSLLEANIVANAYLLLQDTHGAWWSASIYYISVLVIPATVLGWNLYLLLKNRKFRNVNKWGKYIKVVLEDMEEEAKTWGRNF